VALADAAKALQDGSPQAPARQRVEEARQDFVALCDIM
jgi:hypothetical protein